MTHSEIPRLRFTSREIEVWAQLDRRHVNWPVVYLLDGQDQAYVGETRSALSRMRQHLASPEKSQMTSLRVVIDDTFNKSVCLDLESYLIKMLAGDGRFQVINRNDGVTDSDYFDRARYREAFADIFEQLRAEGVFTHSVSEIENSDLFKLSPFKALSIDQQVAIEGILDGLSEDLAAGRESTITIQGDPGTGKTVVGVFFLKLLVDIARTTAADEIDVDSDSPFAEFFVEGIRELFGGLRIGIVVPQQSLRKSIRKVFKKTPGLDPAMVVTPFQVGFGERYDLLIVDETHRLNHRANQPAGTQNRDFARINERLFGADDLTHTQLDWIRAQSSHQIFLLDAEQSVRPADLPSGVLKRLVDATASQHRHYRLMSQMRVKSDSDYVGYIRRLLGKPSAAPARRPDFGDYEFTMFDDLGEMHAAIRARDAEVGLSRLIAGYAWKWVSKGKPGVTDIHVDGIDLPWNRTQTDWIASPGSLDEVGSIHTVQGYDLNYAGVIIGPDLRYDAEASRLWVDRKSYFDKKGMENNPRLGIVYTDDDLLRFITNIYAVLLTRGMLGTYVYVCDPALREYLRERMAL
jgi:DUF2075 family protein